MGLQGLTGKVIPAVPTVDELKVLANGIGTAGSTEPSTHAGEELFSGSCEPFMLL